MYLPLISVFWLLFTFVFEYEQKCENWYSGILIITILTELLIAGFDGILLF